MEHFSAEANVTLRGGNMGDLARKIGERIRQLRKEKGFSQEELAEKADVHFTYIGQLERGEKNASIDTLERITKCLGISLEDFFGLVESPSKDSSTINIAKIKFLLDEVREQEQAELLEIIELLIKWKQKNSQ
jgi:XRE family transcriptional regulator, regulator of sulfur utilization